jgi:hypothetical protein
MNAHEGVSIPIRILDQFGKPLDKLNKGAQQAADRWQKLNGKFNQSPRSLNQLNAVMERTKKLYMASTDPERMKKYAAMISATEKRMSELEKSTQNCSDKTQTLLGKYKGFITIGAAIAAGRKVFDFLGDSSKAAAEVEKYNVTLKTMLGSTTAARDRMQEYMNIAAKTPFSLNEVVEGGNKLQAIGRYSQQNLVMLGDLAAASGKPLEQVMNAFSKLATNQKGEAVNMFRDLLISTDDWVKATGKGVQKSGELKATTKEMIAALPKIMASKGFFGMMANQAETTTGKISNLEDSVFQLKAAIGEYLNPTIKEIVEHSTRWVDKMRKYIEIPIEQKIAAEKIGLNFLVEKLIDTNTKEDERKRHIDELQRLYPEFLKNIDIEKTTTDELRKALELTNAEYDKKIRKSALASQIETLTEEAKENMADIAKYQLSEFSREKIKAPKKQLDDFIMKYNAQSFLVGTYRMKPLNFAIRDFMKSESGEKISDSDRITMKHALAEYEAAGRWILRNDKPEIAKARKKYDKYMSNISALQEMYDSEFGLEGDASPQGGNNNNNNNNNNEKNLNNELNDMAKTISAGGNKPTHITINLQKEMLGELNIYPQTLQQGTEEIKTTVMNILAQVLNSANRVAQ